MGRLAAANCCKTPILAAVLRKPAPLINPFAQLTVPSAEAPPIVNPIAAQRDDEKKTKL
jgi:hypothetical protein